MTTTILFLCPHGAAKSVLAAALFQRLAAERGLPLRATNAGTAPDPAIAPHVRALLAREGLELPLEQPQLVTADLLREAAYCISLGCTRDELPLDPGHWEQWDDIPPPSQDLDGAYRLIRQRLTLWLDRFSAEPMGTDTTGGSGANQFNRGAP